MVDDHGSSAFSQCRFPTGLETGVRVMLADGAHYLGAVGQGGNLPDTRGS